ncbi:peptidoglycan-binding domain-containing protein [Microvirga splendida]|uniref:Peptidoglycan-binding protein n=1 Tax=Microvirga splendida TaxID=2795727 RepID=A0ABS0Y1Q6_9HYPH|nr:peptidoglycan-binding domain-containing protein [Microvirga splendida]MBJ6126226.1 peptidoglycan-binding protein [Microvirga splendida]
MREAFADQPDDDLDLPAVVRRKAPARPPQRRAAKPQRRLGMAEQAAAFVFGHPRQILAALFLTGCGGAIAWNALALQNSRHPAPLFNTREIVLAPEPSPEAGADQPLPPVRPGTELTEQSSTGPNPHAFVPHAAAPEAGAVGAATKPVARSPITEMIRNGGQPAPAAAPPARAQQPAPAAPPARTAARDPIADMIRMGGPVPVPPGNVGRPDPGDTVLAGQRALARLGYSVKVDGLMGSGTRQAIERFEQDRRLPVTGEFNGRTMRELSNASGIAVQ